MTAVVGEAAPVHADRAASQTREGSVPVTVVIAARNEAAHIVECIESIRWAGEVIVAEHGSTDDTARLAREAGAMVISEPAPTIGAQRNAAISRAAMPWVLVVDADERGTPALRDAVAAVARAGEAGIATSGPAAQRHEAYRVPRRNFFLGREIRHGGWDRDRPVRLFRSALRYDDSKVHERVVTRGTVGTLPAPLLHTPYRSLDQYFEKLDRYSRWWAEQRYERGTRTSVVAVLYKPPARFVKMYLLQLGVLDSARGVLLAALAAVSVLAKYARLWAMQHDALSHDAPSPDASSRAAGRRER